ncbi:glycosyltransferase family 2 protein [Hymenobacter sp. BT188]|uniref:glycosyltransferase family 2 protein n=1 Tax=Hymenobacter sp. BT188 TaxID=2763504 RepID=UPI00165189FE|nr:glycosyltransferase family A protein [Hymenobacter sp. BT188]MBC6608746.1 glycosyltransferase family 2 protein [Hymenobacter sp. BT188]
MPAPLISVILPVYNQEPYLAQTIESILAQSYPNFELLLHDDGSTDGSAHLIRHYAALDPRIHASFAPNAGKCATTNLLVSQARGYWCAFLDADDVMLPERLARQVVYHQTQLNVDATSCHCHYIDELGQYLGTQRYPGLRTVQEGRQAMANGQLVHCAFTGLMVSRHAFMESGGLRNQFWPCEDLEFCNRLLEQGFSLVIIQEVLVLYRIHAASVTMRKPLHVFDMAEYSTRCLALRRAGEAELTVDEFMAERQRSPWWVKVNRQRYGYSVIFYRQANFYLHKKDYLHFGWLLTKALLLSPAYGLATVRKRLAQHFSSSTPLSPSSGIPTN